MITKGPEHYLSKITITDDYGLLKNCRIVVEYTIENIDIKKSVYEKIEKVVSSDASLPRIPPAIPITILQGLTHHPERFMGLHWREPSHTIPWNYMWWSNGHYWKAEWLYPIGACMGERTTLLPQRHSRIHHQSSHVRDVQRACYLVENGYASIEDVDRACHATMQAIGWR